ncbi:hypothetical protein CONPUDRAFT_52565 [Coniophora puteana RWD-64-598 SS2]|uniref:C3H1-type domain-containing protein n=1 Tax=Coniophora puteana (strain RWD-64-598) TaxID=741705 RepID=A0A5M3MV92_CONPW|nr:uncharacterized protein CONPUDRAFT_52565 [Coniophora puteana RWD-64-598 SS2]EIW83092.1 hypothetical protein CONPUDRAFT_52565 [Coniophora puteana RWD-64-598 SS2]
MSGRNSHDDSRHSSRRSWEEPAEDQHENLTRSELIERSCEAIVDDYRHGRVSNKVLALRQIEEQLNPEETGLSDREYLETINSYLTLLDDHDFSLRLAEQRAQSRRSPSPAGNRPAEDCDDEEDEEDDNEPADSFEDTFHWEQTRSYRAACSLDSDLVHTLYCYRLWSKRYRDVVDSLVNAPNCPPFPYKEWARIVRGKAVDLDAILSGINASAINDDRTTSLGDGFELRVKQPKTSRPVTTSGDWTSAWNQAISAYVYVFPYRRDELNLYSDHINGLFGAVGPRYHHLVIAYDKAVRTYVEQRRSLTLDNIAAFDSIKISHLFSIGLHGSSSSGSRPESSGGRSGSGGGSGGGGGKKSNEPCHRWNKGTCPNSTKSCTYKHHCETCHGNHVRADCSRGKGSA